MEKSKKSLWSQTVKIIWDFSPPPVPALPAPEKKSDLRDNFRAAVYGGSFRTAAFRSAQGPGEWLKAVARRPDQWEIIHIGEDMLAGEKAYKHHPLKTGLTMFEAVETLARHEILQLENEASAVEGQGRGDLGYEHYEAFGKREGLAFDTGGMPHPALAGEIVTKGSFSAAMEKEVKEAARQKAQDSLARFGAASSLAPLFGPAHFETDFKAISACLDRQSAVAKRVHSYCALIVYARIMLACGFDRKKKDVERFQKEARFAGWHYREEDMRSGWLTFESLADTARNSMTGEGSDCFPLETRKQYIEMVNLLQSYFFFARAASAAADLKKEDDTPMGKMKNFKDSFQDAVRHAQNAGAQPQIITQMQAAILSAAPPRELPPVFCEYFATLEALYKETQAATGREWKKAETPRP